jgi:HK97 family phage portal protein
MGLGQLFARSTEYAVTDTKTGASETFLVRGNVAPDWAPGPYSGAMSLPGAWRCALLRADLLGQVPWHAYRTRAGNPVPERLTPNPLLLEQPNPPDPRMVTLVSLLLDLIWDGNGIALITSRGPTGWPTSYLPIPAAGVYVARARQGDDTGQPPGTVCYMIGGTWYPWTEVIHVKGPCAPGALRGMGALEQHLTRTLALAQDQQRQARDVGSGAVPTGTLKSTDPEFDEHDARELKAEWVASQRQRSVAVLNSTTEFQPVAWNPTELQLLEARKYSLHETALIMGVDPSWLGVAGSSMTYANVESQAVNLVKFTLSGDVARLEQTLTLHMPRGTWAQANLDAILRGDTLSRYQAHALAVGQWLTVDEIRELESRAPLTPAQRAAMAPAPAPAAAPAPAPPISEGAP